MKPRDIIIILLCCIMWGANIPITRWALNETPPILFAALRFLSLIIILFPFLLPVPKQILRVFFVSMCIGGLNFLFLYIGIQSTPSGIVAIIGQLGLPITIFFSVWFLKEKITNSHKIGILLAFFGVIIALFKPANFFNQNGIIMVFISTILASFGNVLMKKMQPIRGIQLQAWVGFFSVIPLLTISIFNEKINFTTLLHFEPKVWISLVFSVCCVSIIGHTTYYSMVKRYDVSKVIPYTVTVPIWAILISHFIFNEKISIQFIIGSIVCIFGISVLSFKNLSKIIKIN